MILFVAKDCQELTLSRAPSRSRKFFPKFHSETFSSNNYIHGNASFHSGFRTEIRCNTGKASGFSTLEKDLRKRSRAFSQNPISEGR